MSISLPTHILNHRQKVCSLYKRSLRNIESWYERRLDMRREWIFLRARFDEKKDIKDLIVAQKIYREGEEELFRCLHPFPKKFVNSPGGSCYERDAPCPDWVLDTWHPIEKAAYPDYFARREQRKKEYIKLWEKNFGRDM